MFPSPTLARCYWQNGQLNLARREFQSALARKEARGEYLSLCLYAVDHPARQPDAVDDRHNPRLPYPRMIWAIASASFSGVQERMSIPTFRHLEAVVLLYSGRAE